MTQPVVRVEGAQQLARALSKVDKDAGKALAKSNRTLARRERDVIRGNARSGTPQQREMAGGIGSRASKSDARITVRNTKGAPGATSTFWGQKQRFGWYAHPRYAGGPPQGPSWVGSSWSVATKGQGPHVINDTLADRVDEIAETYLTDQFALIQRHVSARLGRR